MIASVAIEYDIPLLHNDRDFDNIAKHSKLRIYDWKCQIYRINAAGIRWPDRRIERNESLALFYVKIHRHTGVGRYPVIYTWIPDQVGNDVQHFHVSLCPKRTW